jgi:hypothetical protein
MATEKATGRRAVDYGDQVAGLHNVCDDLVGAVAETLHEHSAAGFYLPLRPTAILAAPGGSAEGPAPQGAHDDRPDASLSGSPGSG